MYILLDYEKKSSFVNVLLKKSFLSTKLGNCTEEGFISEGVTWNLDGSACKICVFYVKIE